MQSARNGFLHLARFLGLALLAGIGRADPASDFFEQRIRPVLAEHCYECHGPEKQKGGLRVDSRAALLAGGDSGPAFVAGDPAASLLHKAVTHASDDLKMPSRQPKLPEPVIADIARWIREGASWPGPAAAAATPNKGFDLDARKERLPWIWRTPARQPVPDISGPGGTPAGTDVDRFILSGLAAKKLSPAPPVDDATWLRRAHFTITGLPPTLDELHAFLAAPAATRRASAVDRLLASPHFGERWARHWMDLIRYAESRGHEFDYGIANAWQYRDYLIRAFNADVPYDRFVSEHVAGDLLPPRTDPRTGANESVLATGWAFLGEEPHSPVDIRGDESDRLDNKVDVFSKTFLGLTIACARCHDHKFDALTQKDYYALSGFIASASYRQARFETEIQHADVSRRLEEVRARHAPAVAARVAGLLKPGARSLGRSLLDAVAAPERAGTAWTNELAQAGRIPGHPLARFVRAARGADRAPTPAVSEVVLADFTVPGAVPWKVDGPAFGPGVRRAGELLLALDPGQPRVRVAAHGAAVRDAFWNRLSLTPGNEPDSGSLGAHHRAGRMVRTPRVTLGSGQVHYLIRGKARVYAAVDAHIMLSGPLHGRLVTTLDGGANPSWVSHDLTPYAGHRAHFEFAPADDGPLEILKVVEAPERPTAMPWETAGSDAGSATLESLATTLEADLVRGLDLLASSRLHEKPLLAPITAWAVDNATLLGVDGSGIAESLSPFIAERDALASTVRWESRTAPALLDGGGWDERVLIRGKHGRPGAPAPRSLPVAFGCEPAAPRQSGGRLELATQMVSPSNPLVARVMVNRVWHHLFGRGLVPTPDNFGYLGERPTHPELLDHLAWQFVHEDHWSIKSLVRRLVLTDTFAMGSVAADPATAAEVDPSNLLWHRIPIRRLEGEAIRDAMLVVSGRFNPAAGGPPVPIHLTSFHESRGRPDRSGPLDGEGRRSVYGAIRRNFMAAMQVAFDFPTPFSTMGRRNRTNVPAQSLVLMNDPFVHEQASVWAARVLREGPADDAGRIRFLFETGLARSPAADELASCRDSLALFRSLQGDGPESGAWTDLCHALLNMSEFIHVK